MEQKDIITTALKEFILADRNFRNNPISWRSVMPHSSDPSWSTFSAQRDRYRRAQMELWAVTDVEFAEDGFRNIVWEWRYWKVMVRKCCWYQTLPLFLQWQAGHTMSKLQEAELNLVEVCGLMDEYKPASYYIEKQFPNLKS